MLRYVLRFRQRNHFNPWEAEITEKGTGILLLQTAILSAPSIKVCRYNMGGSTSDGGMLAQTSASTEYKESLDHVSRVIF